MKGREREREKERERDKEERDTTQSKLPSMLQRPGSNMDHSPCNTAYYPIELFCSSNGIDSKKPIKNTFTAKKTGNKNFLETVVELQSS